MDGRQLNAEVLLAAYAQGAFPMGRSGASRQVDWYRPDPRAVLPLDEGFRVRRSLARRVRADDFVLAIDRDFPAVIRACAQPRPPSRMMPGNADTWISPDIARAYTQLHHAGFAHSVEAYADDVLVGGLYGVALGSVFFGESMFSRRPDASQVCLVHLVEKLRADGFTLLDVQFLNPHLLQFGAYEMPGDMYDRLLAEAVDSDERWDEARSL